MHWASNKLQIQLHSEVLRVGTLTFEFARNTIQCVQFPMLGGSCVYQASDKCLWLVDDALTHDSRLAVRSTQKRISNSPETRKTHIYESYLVTAQVCQPSLAEAISVWPYPH